MNIYRKGLWPTKCTKNFDFFGLNQQDKKILQFGSFATENDVLLTTFFRGWH